jgi:hypothetical protein
MSDHNFSAALLKLLPIGCCCGVVEESVLYSNGGPIVGNDGKPAMRMRERTRTAGASDGVLPDGLELGTAR